MKKISIWVLLETCGDLGELITCTSVICEPRAKSIFSVLVGYGLSRCL